MIQLIKSLHLLKSYLLQLSIFLFYQYTRNQLPQSGCIQKQLIPNKNMLIEQKNRLIYEVNIIGWILIITLIITFILKIEKQEQQNMKNKETIYRLLLQNYRQFIQFINDISISANFYVIIVYVPSVIIFCDLFNNMFEQNFLYRLFHINIAEQLTQLSNTLPALQITVKILAFIFMLIPICIIVMLIVVTLVSQAGQVEISYFYHIYNKSNICKSVRLYFYVYQYIFYPIIVSIGIKMLMVLKEEGNSYAFGVILMILALLNSLLFHYYTLQLPSQKCKQSPTQFINFPNALIQSGLIFVTIIINNTTTGITPFISCLALFILRAITGHFLRFYHPQIYYQHFFKILFCCSISLGLLIGYINSQTSIMVVFICIALCILIKAKSYYIENSKQYIEVYVKPENNQSTVKDVKYYLKYEKIAKAFKEAVLISRKKNSHRVDLMIDILKRKCYHLESESRGSTKMANSLLLLQYEVRIVKIVKNFLSIQQKAIQVLTIMKNKEPKQQLLIKNVVDLVDHINLNKQQFNQCIKINSRAAQLTVLMRLFFKHLYNDGVYLRQINTLLQDQILVSSHRRIKKQLFSKDTALIVVKVIDEIGKISKVSNNLPNVLGYSSHSLVGLSINELIPISIRQIHDEILNNFINSFTSEFIRQKHSIQFYAYNKQFHLQKLEIKYKIFLHNFETCQLSSIVRKLKTQQHLILTDQFGNIQGWSPKVGEAFNFDELTGNDCNAYNIQPLIPTIIKYDTRANNCLRTVFFRLSKMKNPKLMIFDFKKQNFNIEQFKKAQHDVFLNLLQKGDIIEAFLVKIQIQVKVFERYKKALKIIRISDLKRIQNFQVLQSAVFQGSTSQKKNQCSQAEQKFDFNPNFPPQKSVSESEEAQFSILKSNCKFNQPTDLNFTLDFNKQSVLQVTDFKLSKDFERFQSAIFSSRSLLKIQAQQNKQEYNFFSDSLTVQSNFNPKLERRNNFVCLVILISVAILALIIAQQISFSYVIQQMSANKTEIFNANRAEMIYCKSVFNPNETYINQFNSGALLIKNSWLYDQNTTYITQNGDQVTQNLFYMFNVQIPSNLDLILQQPGITKEHRNELQRNFYNVISQYEKVYNIFQSQWSAYIDKIKAQSAYKTIAYSIGSIIYIVFVCLIQNRYKNQRKMTEAFFKFEKQDLDDKISSINMIGKTIQKRCEEWFLSQQLSEAKKGSKDKKSNNMLNDTFGSSRKQNNTPNVQKWNRKSQPKDLDESESKLAKNRLYFIIGIVVAIFITQLLYLILHGVLVRDMLNSYKYIINKYDQANKLIVYPNLKLANAFYPASADIISVYQESVQQTLNQPIEYMPDLFNLLSESPCTNCSFLSQILGTNYRSFYSYFMQVMATFNSSNTNVTELYYAIDVVTENITNSLIIKPVSNPTYLILLYIFSLILFFGSVFYITSELNQECLKLQCFLKFFNTETLLKNKHMSTIMAKNA